jgi:hypothetical protein
VKSLPPTVAVLHRSISLYEMPDLLPGLGREYGTTTPSYREGVTGVRVVVGVGVMLRFLLFGEDGVRFLSLI